MCDYSLHAVNNRLAVEGESLVVHRFPTSSKGLASPADFEAAKPRGLKMLTLGFLGLVKRAPVDVPAVCVPPGAKLRLERIPDALRATYALSDAEEATFTQLTAEPFAYRDAFRFKNGAEVLIQKFDEQTRVEVLALALAEETDPEETEAEEPAEVEEPATSISYEQFIGRSVRANV